MICSSDSWPRTRVFEASKAGRWTATIRARRTSPRRPKPPRKSVTAPGAFVDEIGYLPVTQDGAVLFFQLINTRHERASTVLTSNKGFEEWGGVLGSSTAGNPSR